MLQTNKVNIGTFPTQVTKEDTLAAIGLEGKVNLFIKHEGRNNDETGVGVKIRQIEYLFAAAIERGHTHLIVDGVIDSHCCIAISNCAKRYEFEAVLVIKDDEPLGPIPEPHKRMIGSGAEMHYIGKKPEPEKLEQIKQKIAAEFQDRGAKPMIVPTGATSELTIPGGIDIAKEIADYEAKHRVKFDYVALPVGTGGIYLGLEVGRRKMDKEWKVLGVIIDDNPPEYYRQRFIDIGKKFIEANGLSSQLLEEALSLHIQRGNGYGLFGQKDLADIERISHQTGINFDPVYMYKYFKGLQQLVNIGEIPVGSNVLLIHTGN